MIMVSGVLEATVNVCNGLPWRPGASNVPRCERCDDAARRNRLRIDQEKKRTT